MKRPLVVALLLAGCYDFDALDQPGDLAFAVDGARDQSAPDLADGAAADAAMADASADAPPMPDLAGEDLAMPDLAGDDLAMPDLAGDDLAMPDLVMPDLAMPDLANANCNPPQPAKANQISFGALATTTVGAAPFAVAVGDLDGDCLPDVVVADSGANNVAVLLDQGGTLAMPAYYTVGTQPYGLALADFDRDGHLDVVTANHGGNDVTVRRGKGDGTLLAVQATVVTMTAQPWGIAAARLGGDNPPDLLVADTANNLLHTLTGQGDGTFIHQSQVGAGAPANLALGSFNQNNDALLDVAVATMSGGPSWYLNAGNGDQVLKSALGLGSNPSHIAVGDLDGDGREDFAQTNAGGSDVTLMHSVGDGTFTRIGGMNKAVGGGGNPAGMVVADFDGDGNPDFAVALQNANGIAVERSVGGGMFAGELLVVTPNGAPYHLATADLDRDGRPDLIYADKNNNKVGVFLNTSN